MSIRTPRFIFRFILIGILAATGAEASSEISTASQVSTSVIPTSPSARPLKLSSTLSYNSTLHEANDPARQSDMSLELVPAYLLTDSLTFGVDTILRKNLRGEEKLSISDTSLLLRDSGYQLNPFLKLSPGGSVIVPTSDDSRNRSSLLVGLKVAPRIWIRPFKSAGPIQFNVELGMTRNIHQYTVATTGDSNNRYVLSQIFRAYLTPTEKLKLTTVILRGSAWTYRGSLQNSFEFSQEATYDLTDSLNVGAGFGNSGKLLKANGTDSNFSAFNSQTSTVYGLLGMEL